MNPGRFFLPNFSTQISPLVRGGYLPSATRLGLFSNITNYIKRFNWSGLLNGANKTLNVVNQTIPLVRQAGPMVNNMKNMFKIAKAFGNETAKTKLSNINNKLPNNKISNESNSSVNNKEISDTNYPNFFI